MSDSREAVTSRPRNQGIIEDLRNVAKAAKGATAGPWLVSPILESAAKDLERLNERVTKLEDHIRDIDAHSTPLGYDEDGFITTGYAISVGCLHRALGTVNG